MVRVVPGPIWQCFSVSTAYSLPNTVHFEDVWAKTAEDKDISFAKTKITLKKGKTTKLKYTITKKTYTTVTFSSSNKKVVSVDKNGKIKALKKGTATIIGKVKIGKKTKKLKCKVKI